MDLRPACSDWAAALTTAARIQTTTRLATALVLIGTTTLTARGLEEPGLISAFTAVLARGTEGYTLAL